MFLKKLADFFTSKKIDEDTSSHSNDVPLRIDVTRLPLFEEVDPTVRYMINEHQQFIREHITFINLWIKEQKYNSAANKFVRLKWVDYLNSEIPKFEQNAELMSVVRTLPQQPNTTSLHCPFRRVYPFDKYNKCMFELTDEGYRHIVTAPYMPNRAYSMGESWRTREKTPDDETYFDTALEIIFHYYLVGFDKVDHPSFKRSKKD
ncbi:hypothetical protein [Spirosoma pollinicola]|uniref:Uncharacterized protein n=1 Tax=Spirosoma pollinicola TaxID=2057025 RepID=A0A2K8YX15_9BACT|nr:hypothetical protein [Spirosoma pollinicola]AUD02172.1 hypothetical protein CWM47_10275 [Spirosoma pollinicola]